MCCSRPSRGASQHYIYSTTGLTSHYVTSLEIREITGGATTEEGMEEVTEVDEKMSNVMDDKVEIVGNQHLVSHDQRPENK